MVTTKQRQDFDKNEGQGFASMDTERQRGNSQQRKKSYALEWQSALI